MLQRRTLQLLACASAILLGASGVRSARAEDSALDNLVVAVVNGEEITRKQLGNRLLEYSGDESLEKMINRALLTQEAARLKVSVSDGEISQKLDEFRKKFRNEQDFKEFLDRSRITERQLTDEFRSTLLIQKVALKEKPITDDDLEQLDARMIDAPDKAAAEALVKELDGGANFAQLAQKKAMKAELRSAQGRLKEFLQIELIDIWKAIADQKLKPGAYTKTPVQLDDKTWAVIILEDRIPASKVSGVERERLNAVVTTYRVSEWIDSARKKADVKKMPLTEPVVATVNGQPITQAQLVSRLIAYHGKEALGQAVNRTMLLQAAKKLGVAVSDAEADQRFKEIRTSFTEDDAYRAFLTRSSLSEKQFRDDLRYTVLMEKVALKESPITDDDLLRYDASMLTAPSKAIAIKWIDELNKGTNFGQMVRQRAADPNARAVNGKMKPFLKIEILDIWRAIKDQGLKPGDHTREPVLLTDNSWNIIKLDGLIPVTGLPDAERKRLVEQVTQYRVNQWLSQATQRSTFSYPTEISSAAGTGG